MNTTYWLSLGTSLLFLLGFCVTLRKFIRQPSPAWLVMLGAIVLYGWGLLHMSLNLPSYAQAKAFYGFRLWRPSARSSRPAGTGSLKKTGHCE